MTLLLGIDLGTSSVKAVLFDVDTARIAAVATREYPIDKPAPDRAEQRPDDWWEAAVDVVQRAVAQAGRNDVAAIGFSGQMHATVLIGGDGTPLQPAIIWPDQRSAAEVRTLIETVGEERYAEICGTLP